MMHRVSPITFLRDRLRFSRAHLIHFAVLLTLAPAAGGQSWTSLNHQPGVPVGTAMLLTDGTVMVQQMQTNGFATGNWLRLTPDITGSYVNGTWSSLASLPSGYAPLFYASAVLPDGRVIVEGGEHNGNTSGAETNQGAIYNPATNLWTSISPPSGITRIGDASSVVLANGTFMMGNCCQTAAFLLNASNLTWTSTGSGKADSYEEEGLTLLPSGNVLTVDTEDGTNSEIYNPSTQSWSSAGSTIVQLANSSVEIGPAVLRPDGTVFAAGGTSNTAIYSTTTGGWSAGPTFSGSLDVADGPAALLPSGNVLIDSSPGVFNNGTEFFEFNGSSLVTAPSPANAGSRTSFQGRMLVLPTGQILFTDQSSTVQIYSPSGTFQNTWRPAISSVASTLNQGSANNSISGTQFNGLSQGAMYGDDAQMATNYPLVRITNNSTGHVFYAKTHNHSTMAVATAGTTVSTQFDVPSNIEAGASTLVVVTNGIPSTGVSVNIPSHATGLVGFAGYFSCESDDQYVCDTGTITVTVNNTTKTTGYDGSGQSTGTGFGVDGDPGIPQTIAQTIANAFNSDPNSPVTATAVQDGYLESNAWDVFFTAKTTGPSGDYSTSISVVPTYGAFSYFNTVTEPIGWTLTVFPGSGGGDPTTLTEATPLFGSLTGGH